MSSVTSTTSTSSTASTLAELNSSNGSTGDSTLDEADFLKLLTAQLAAQDPLDPESNTDFIAQMATFSQLEQMNTMSENMSAETASNYIGKTVTASDSDGNTVTGVVSSISIDSGDVTLNIGDSSCALDTVTNVATTTSTATE
jgi:flagellar basal-body rod modification protein FlgD